MKKIIGLLCLMSILTVSTVCMAEESTYTEKFIKKHTSKIVNKEKQLTAKQKAEKAKYEAQKKAAQKKQTENKKKVEKKKKAWKELTTF